MTFSRIVYPYDLSTHNYGHGTMTDYDHTPTAIELFFFFLLFIPFFLFLLFVFVFVFCVRRDDPFAFDIHELEAESNEDKFMFFCYWFCLMR